MSIKYPPKPWRDGQIESLVSGIDFMYNAALKNWVPISPGFSNRKQLQEIYGSDDVNVIKAQVYTIESKLVNVDSDIELSGRIWKTRLPPNTPHNNDVWIDLTTGKVFSYVAKTGAWVELNYVG